MDLVEKKNYLGKRADLFTESGHDLAHKGFFLHHISGAKVLFLDSYNLITISANTVYPQPFISHILFDPFFYLDSPGGAKQKIINKYSAIH